MSAYDVDLIPWKAIARGVALGLLLGLLGTLLLVLWAFIIGGLLLMGCASSGPPPPPPGTPPYVVDLRPERQVLVRWADWEESLIKRPTHSQMDDIVATAVDRADACDESDHDPWDVVWMVGGIHVQAGRGEGSTCTIGNPWRRADTQYHVNIRVGRDLAQRPHHQQLMWIESCIAHELTKAKCGRRHPQRYCQRGKCPCWLEPGY